MSALELVHLAGGNLYGGIEAMLEACARVPETSSGVRQRFVVCFEGRLARGLREAGAEVEVLGPLRLSRPWTVVRARRALRASLDAHPGDAVVCHGAWCQAIFGSLASGRPESWAYFAHDAATGSPWLDRLATRTSPAWVIANSAFIASTLAGRFQGVPRRIVHPPVALRGPDASERAAVRAELQTPLEVPVVIQASRLERWKGQTRLFDALGALPPELDWACWLVGGPQRPEEERYLAELRAQVDALGLSARVRFLGQRSDVPRLLRAADVHCQPNLGPEPFGVALIEALDAGLPVVTSAQGGALEIVDETVGLRVGDGREELATALRRLLSDRALRTALGAQGPARARALCNPVTQVGRLAEIFSRPGAEARRSG